MLEGRCLAMDWLESNDYFAGAWVAAVEIGWLLFFLV
jgi:hypothetical protein